MVASVGISQVVLDKKDKGVEQTIDIFVAVKDLDTLQKLSAETVKLEKWPKDRLPDGAILKFDDLENKYTNQRLYAGEPILARKLMDSADDVSTKIPKGYRVFDLSVTDRNGGVGYIKPGDHVDVVGTFNVRGTSEGRTVMRNVKVFGINGNTVRESDGGKNAKASTVQLLVKQSQLEALTLANTMGELRLSLRPPGDSQDESTDNGTDFMNWLNKAEQAAKPAPAIAEAIPDLFKFNTAVSKVEDDKNQLLIITPSGVTTYKWSKDNEMPRKEEETSSTGGNKALNGSGQFSGTGGYAPNYPGGAAPTSGQKTTPTTGKSKSPSKTTLIDDEAATEEGADTDKKRPTPSQ